MNKKSNINKPKVLFTNDHFNQNKVMLTVFSKLFDKDNKPKIPTKIVKITNRYNNKEILNFKAIKFRNTIKPLYEIVNFKIINYNIHTLKEHTKPLYEDKKNGIEKTFRSLKVRSKNNTPVRNHIKSLNIDYDLKKQLLDIFSLNKDEKRKIKDEANQLIMDKNQNQIEVKESEYNILVNSSINILKESKTHVIKSLIAFIVLSGRRAIEICKQGNFTLLDDNHPLKETHVRFYGQAKLKTRDENKDGLLIPIACDTKYFIDKWNGLLDKRNEMFKDANTSSSFSKKSSNVRKEFKKLLDKLGLDIKSEKLSKLKDEDGNLLKDNKGNPLKSKIGLHNARSLYLIYHIKYSLKTYENYLNKKLSNNAFASLILGHDVGDLHSANSYQFFRLVE